MGVCKTRGHNAIRNQSPVYFGHAEVDMDDRQTKIRAGAGLEDSRINKEFVDFLNKWSSPVLLTLAVAAGIWWVMQYMERKQNARIDQAFGELQAATAGGNPSPSSLTTIASDYAGVRSVPELAKLTAADIYLRAFTVGIEPGAQFDPITRRVFNPDDVLTPERRAMYLDLAQTTANEVLSMSQGKPGKALFAMQALTRLAAVQEGKRDFKAARGFYDQLKSLGTQEQYPTVVTFAESRIANLDSLKQVGNLPSNDQVPALPGEGTIPSEAELNALIQQAQQQAEQAQAATGDDATQEQPSNDPAQEPTSNDNP